MTGFASGTGAMDGARWSWELRSVNGRGLDLRLRVPDWIAGLEPALRTRLGQAMARGSVTLNLRVTREGETGALTLDTGALDTVLDALAEAESRAMARGLTLAPATAADLIGLRGVLDIGAAPELDTAPLKTALLEDFEGILSDFLDARAREGAALAEVLTQTVDRIAALTAEARALVPARGDALRAGFLAAVDRAALADLDEARAAQEIALLAVKTDVAEELDRLEAHVEAARALIASDTPAGRKLDFLSQEFNREANTLCSKAQHGAMTALGLEMKVAIDQLREQVQNVE